MPITGDHDEIRTQPLGEPQLPREGDTHLRVMLEAIPLIAFVVTIDGQAGYANQRWEECFGLTFDEVRRRRGVGLVEPADLPQVRERWVECLTSGQTVEVEQRLRRKDGQMRWYLGRAVPLRDAEGRTTGWCGTLTDIHDLKEAKEAQRLAAERLRAAMYAAGMDAFEADIATGRVMRASDGGPRPLGIGDDDLGDSSEAFFRRLHPEDRTMAAELIGRLTPAAPSYRLEFRVIRDDGEVLWLVDVGSGEFGPDGKLSKLRGVLMNITERKRAELERARVERELRESEERFRAMSDRLPLLVWVYDEEGRQAFMNQTLLDFAGLTLEQAMRGEWRACLHPDDEPGYVGELRRCIAERRPFHAETRARRADGEWRWIESWGQPRFDEAGELRGYVGTSVDVTERRRIEQEREKLLAAERAARAEVERAGRIKDEFLATLSHELRTPLTAILGWAEILERRLSSTAEYGPEEAALVRKGVKVIARNTRLQAQLVEELLDVSRIVSGKLKLDVGTVDAGAVAAAAAETIRPVAEAKGLTLDVRIAPHGLECRGDGGRLQQVLWNLLSNAVKFTPPGGVVTLTASAEGMTLRLTVEDTGQGIDPTFLPRLFERFSQADVSTARTHGGLGLGLSIVKDLVVLQGGTVAAESAGPGRGARFTVTLPRAAPG